ncbi:hypothetical protein [Puniceicoccus vermicola]|uniref:hypothetical protein n=1 Tax=Puniceicoccus vermicola TaxID=388746 RepID=UPI00339B205D
MIEGGNGQIPIIVAEPTDPEPKALVVYIPEPKAGSPDPLHYLADHGLVGIGVEIDPEKEKENILRVRQWIASVDSWQQLPIYYVGYRETWPILATLYEHPSSSDHGLFFLTPEPTKPAAPESGQARIPLYVLDLRPNAEELKMASDHPLAGTTLESSRWIKIPGEEDMERGKRWQALWETIADMSQ